MRGRIIMGLEAGAFQICLRTRRCKLHSFIRYDFNIPKIFKSRNSFKIYTIV